MKYFKYILRNATRNKLRSALTVLSLCFCLALMTILYGFVTMQDEFMPQLARGHRVIVMNKQGFAGQIPIAYLDRVRALPGTKAAVPMAWYMGVYKDEKMPFSQMATDADQLFRVWDEFRIDPAQLRAWQIDRQGCVVDRRTAEHRGWKIGEHIPLKGALYDFDLDLVLCGVYDAPEIFQDLYFHRAYLDEGLRQKGSPRAGTTGILFVKAESADVIPELCRTIDTMFANSDYQTWSQSHEAFAQMFSKFVGNLEAYIRNIGFAVLFALTLVAGNTMAMSMRERTTEIAVLKAIGFGRALVLGLLLGESVLIALIGGLFGVTAGRAVWGVGHYFWPQFLPLGYIAWAVLAYGVAVAGGIGLVSGIVPAYRAARLSVIDGLRRVV
jgi:putative ABC transport system permease protein